MTDPSKLPAVTGNRWSDLVVPEPMDLDPTEGVSVVVPYFEAPEALALTMAALEGQTYPHHLIEVVIADDGSSPPLSAPDSTLEVKVVHQEDLGFGLARARNTGAAAAKHDILIFLDCDMIPEAEWMAAHARWHYYVDDTLTLGFRAHTDVGGVTPADITGRSGTLEAIFASQPVERPEWIEFHMSRTADLRSGVDDIFRVVTGGNLGVRRSFLDQVGGFDESFTQWGAEDTEFGFRAYSQGALLIPERRGFCWHQGLGITPDPAEAQSLEQQKAKLAHLIAHPGFRRALPGRSFTIPQVLVVVSTDGYDEDAIIETTEMVLANRVHDLTIAIEIPSDDEVAGSLRRQFELDPRVMLHEPGAALPAASIYVMIPEECVCASLRSRALWSNWVIMGPVIAFSRVASE